MMNSSVQSVLRAEPRVLRGDNVILEPLSVTHVDGLWDIGREAEDWMYLPRSCFQSKEDVRHWVDQALDLVAKKQQICFVLVSPGSRIIMGSTRFLNIREENRGLEIGWTWLGRDFQRSMINTETKYLLLCHAFEQLHALRVEFKTDARNLRSQRAITRIGAELEGTFRQHMVVQNGYVRDSVYFSIIDRDWTQIKPRLEDSMRTAVV